MDNKFLISQAKKFIKACEASGYPLILVQLVEAYPGFSDTSYHLEVGADWIETIPCYKAIEILTGILFESTEFEFRKKIFAIGIHNDENELCRFDDIAKRLELLEAGKYNEKYDAIEA